MATIHALPVPQPAPDARADALFRRAVDSLAADGVTPATVRFWGAPVEDPDVRAYFTDLACTLEERLTSAGVAAVLAASGPPS